MKKTIIAGAAASAVLAAMPVVGVFAADDLQATPLKVTDEVQLTIDANCTFSATTGTDSKNTVTLTGDGISGTFGNGDAGAGVKGSEMTVTCNTTEGWTLNANAADLTNGTESIVFGKFSTTGSSVWSAMVALEPEDANDSSVQILNGWGSFDADKAASNGTIVQAKDGTNGKAGVRNLKITPHYKAFVADGQHPGTYKGDVVYTLTSARTE